MLPKPQSRLELLLNKIATNTMNDLPIPQSRLELLVSALITNDIDNLPSPQSRSEAILHCILLDTECNISPQSRVELFLKSIITLDIEGLPTPMSRLEWYLDYIVRNGCLEKYEYYPFTIRDYLNVKNTPKARMKFKGMKGNTLVNLENNKSRIGKWLMDESDSAYITKPITGYCGFSIPITFSKDKKYTIIYTVISNTTNKTSLPIIAITKNIQSEIIGSLSVGTHAVSITPKETCISPSQWDDHFRFVIHSTNTEVSGNISISNKITILEGDYTQNPPNGYIEGMKSFGESENKIEVLSVGKNLLNPSELIDGFIDDAAIGMHGGTYNVVGLSVSRKLIPIKNVLIGYKFITKNINCIAFYTDNQESSLISRIYGSSFNIPTNAKYFRLECNSIFKNTLQIELGTQSTEYVPYQSSKSIPMYRNSNNELVPVPVLRGKWEGDRFLWGDEIMLHEDGQLYYHKRCGIDILTENSEIYLDKEHINNLCFRFADTRSKYKLSSPIISFRFSNDVIVYDVDKKGLYYTSVLRLNMPKNELNTQDLNGFKLKLQQWRLDGNPLTVIYQLNQEEVYPCELTNQLYSYDGETNIFINGGAVVGETTIEIGTKLGPIVATLKQETKIVTDGLKGVLAGDMQELAYQLYPDDFNKDIVEIKPIESV